MHIVKEQFFGRGRSDKQCVVRLVMAARNWRDVWGSMSSAVRVFAVEVEVEVVEEEAEEEYML